MDLPNLGGYSLFGLERENVILGKNGCGKSRLLKAIEQGLMGRETVGAVRYVSPERAGLLRYEPGIEHNITTSPGWLADTRRQNQAGQFRQQSAAQFRRLELLVLREIEKDPAIRGDLTRTFDSVVARINTLLDRVAIRRGDPTFEVYEKASGQTVDASVISSGESELISLGIECLVFARECVAQRLNVLLLDEPDVHLHPDLQARFARFLSKLLEEAPITLVLATHSTAFLGAAALDAHARVAFMRYGDTEIRFAPVAYTLRRVLPVFGAHPLSNVFNEAPVLLVEGDDDERIWQQAVRSANGQLSLYPVAVDGVDNLGIFEQEVATILQAVYDNAVGYSVRDRDSTEPIQLDPVGPVIRFQLSCRASENLLLSDDVLNRAGLAWAEMQQRIATWAEANSTHPHQKSMAAFVATGFDRRNADLKEIRNDLIGLMGSNKPWEIVVGQTIATLVGGNGSTAEYSTRDFLGASLCSTLLSAGTPQQPGG
ncbi:MAG TPA: AAA family ATPase [Gemmatimonadaceae bacterium]|nr:AAA family ATPase [Gemmatimonadaceae bacterium]